MGASFLALAADFSLSLEASSCLALLLLYILYPGLFKAGMLREGDWAYFGLGTDIDWAFGESKPISSVAF